MLFPKTFFLITTLLCCTGVNGQIIYTYAGDGYQGFTGDGGPATDASLYWPGRITVDSAGDLFIADFWNKRIRMVNHITGIISTIAGNGAPSRSGDGGLATAAGINYPTDMVFDKEGNLYIASDSITDPPPNAYSYSGAYVRKVNTLGIISTVAGNSAVGYSGDGSPATNAGFNNILSIAIDDSGNVYVADLKSRIRKINKYGIINTIVGTGAYGFSGDGGPATNATIKIASDLALDHSGNLYFTDSYNDVIRKVTKTGIITTIAGSDTSWGYSGDGGPATAAQLYLPLGLALDDSGNLYFSDGNNFVVRKINTSGIISTVAGYGAFGYGGDGGPPDSAQFSEPEGVAVDSSGNLFIADVGNVDVRMVCPGCVGVLTPEIITNNEFLVAPNPTTGAFTITLPSTVKEPTRIIVTNLIGQKIKELITINKKTEIALNAPPGIYFVTAITDNGRQSVKVMVQ